MGFQLPSSLIDFVHAEGRETGVSMSRIATAAFLMYADAGLVGRREAIARAVKLELGQVSFSTVGVQQSNPGAE